MQGGPKGASAGCAIELMLKRILIAIAVVVAASGLASAYIWWHSVPKAKGEAYVGAGDVPLWDGTGQVRRRLARLDYGEKVAVLDEYEDAVEVRSAKGTIGWVDQDNLIEPGVWQQFGQLAGRVRPMVTQASGHTRVISNLHLQPGRTTPLIGQLPKNTPVEVLGRGVAEWQGAGGNASPRKEDWLLVRAKTPALGQIAGWALGRFIADDPPDPLPAYAISAAMNPVAWFPLRQVSDPSGPKPYYLMAGTRGAEGQPCDFTMLRVYTWSVTHHQYETAFVQNDVCGKLPITVTFVSDPQQDVHFSFQDLDPSGEQAVTYLMRRTMVREVRAGPSTEQALRRRGPRRRR